MELDNENNRTVFLRESDPFMPILPSPERQEEFLEGGLMTPPSKPIHSPHAFLKKDRWLFSPPPVLTLENTHLDKSETRTDATPHDTDNRLSTRLCEKKGFFKRFDFQKKRFLQQKKRFSVPNG